MRARIKYDVMSQDELNYFKGRMEDLLEQRGIKMNHPALMEALEKAGCIVKKKQVLFPKEVIHKALEAVPKSFTLYSPSGEYDMEYPHPKGGFYTRTCTGAPNYRTADGQVHYAKLSEVEEWYQLTNEMEHVDFVTLPSTSGEEVPPAAVDVYTLEQALKLSKKHIWIQPYGTENVKYLIDMCAEAAGGMEALREKPICSFIACSVPVLSLKYMDAEILYQCAMAGIPVQPCSLPTAGANAPVTGQGVSFVACAEVLAMIVILELLHPGLPVIATPLLFSLDMKTTYTLQSSPEITTGRLLCMQLFEQGYGIPAHSYGTGTDSLVIDEQNLAERATLMQMMAMSDASVLGGAGQLETAKTISPVQLIIDNELFGIAKELRFGLEMNDETLDYEELLQGEDGSGFLMSMHTFTHFKDIYRPELFNRDGYQENLPNGTKTFLEKAMERYEEIRKKPIEVQLSEEKLEKIHQIVENAASNLHPEVKGKRK